MYKILDNYTNYKIFESGEIYDIKKEKFITPFFSKKSKNYKINITNDNNKVIKKYIARLIFETFKGNINKNDIIIYKDNNNNNFNINNLEKIQKNTLNKEKYIIEDNLWKNIPEYENYKISSTGEILSIHSGIIKQTLCASGYNIITLSKNNKPKKFLIHRLVFEIFTNKLIDKNNLL